MIDTDKYEGHIQGEWRDTRHEGALAHHIYAGDKFICTVSPNEATANLVTDAPLFLEEVKRLREENEMLREELKNDDTGIKAIDGLLKAVGDRNKQVKQLRFHLKDVVDELATHLGDYENEMYDWVRKMHKLYGSD